MNRNPHWGDYRIAAGDGMRKLIACVCYCSEVSDGSELLEGEREVCAVRLFYRLYACFCVGVAWLRLAHEW